MWIKKRIDETKICQEATSCFRCPIEHNSNDCNKATLKLRKKHGSKFYQRKEEFIILEESTNFHSLEDEGCSCHVVTPCGHCQNLSERDQ